MNSLNRHPIQKLLLLLALLGLSLTASLAPVMAAEIKVSFIHFSDYHSHAVPFYSEGKANQAGLARTVGYLKQMKAANPNLIVLSGGDSMNLGTPSWSDKYQCAEWTMFSGLIDAMAIGNHEFDYGWDAYLKCKTTINYSLVSANFIYSTTGQLVEKPYVIKEVGGMKIGMFALGGPDFPRLINRNLLTTTVMFADPMPAAKKIVDDLRNTEKVNAVVFFGHQDREADFAMAKAVPGIDIVFGTHSHYKGELQKIEGTNTWFISPFQYLTYLSQVEMTITDGKVTNVTGKLMKMDESVRPDAAVEGQVNKMQTDLEADAKFADKFVKIGTAAVELSNDNLDKGESVLGNFVMDAIRRTTKAHAAFSTSSSFRASIPPGTIRMEDYLTALPYRNIMLVHELTGAQIQELLDYSLGKIGSDNFSVTSGLKYQIAEGKARNVQILKDANNEGAGYEALDAAKKYQVTTTDFQARIAAGYKDIFGKATNVNDTKLIVNDTLIDLIKQSSPVSAKLEGRIQTGAQPAQPASLPRTGAESVVDYTWLVALALGVVLLGASIALRRRA